MPRGNRGKSRTRGTEPRVPTPCACTTTLRSPILPGMGWRIAAAAALMALALAFPAHAQENGCLGDTSANLPEVKPGGKPIVFGIYPGGSAGAVVGPQAQAKPDD